MNNKQSLYLLWATILNQSQSAEVVLKNTFELLKRLNLILNFNEEFQSLDYKKVEGSISTKPCLHRFPRNMSMNIWDSICLINEKYGGMPERVFTNFSNISDVKERLMKFRGIGEHKADTAIIILQIYIGDSNFNNIFNAKCTELYKTVGQEIQILDKLGDVELNYDR